MNRRKFAAILAATLAGGFVEAKTKQKFIVTAGRDILVSQPIEVMATSSLEAVTMLGLTIWTEAEYEEAKKRTDNFGR